jgi:hypothetical protein
LLKFFGYPLFLRFFSPSKELVLIKHSPALEVDNNAKSAGKVSPS